MIKSAFLALFLLALAFGCAFAVRHFGRKAGEPEGKLRALFWLFCVGGVIASMFVFTVDSRQRRMTLFEVLLEGSADVEVGDEIPVRTAEFWVEHPGVEHTLRVQPKLGFGEEATGAVELQILLATKGGDAFVDELHSFEVREETIRGDDRDLSVVHRIWDGYAWRFTPDRAGLHRLEIGIVQVGIHEIFVRVEDPEKRDGKRAPDY